MLVLKAQIGACVPPDCAREAWRQQTDYVVFSVTEDGSFRDRRYRTDSEFFSLGTPYQKREKMTETVTEDEKTTTQAL